MENFRKRSFATRAVHSGERDQAGDFTPVVGPIHPTIGYLYESMDDLDAIFASTREGYVYPRYGSPTVASFETAIADLEGGEAAFAFASGMAAIHVALLAAGLQSGKSVVAAVDLYGASYALLSNLFSRLGVQATFVDLTHLESAGAALARVQPAVLYAETISNPLLKIANVPALAELAHHYQAQLLIDNTFATPYLYNPIADGADMVIHSATKYIAGHGDVMAGVVVSSRENRRRMYELNKLVGSVLGPFEAWLAMRGLKTLPLRVRQQCANASQVAAWLATQPGIDRIYYPGLESHPQHDLASSLFGERGYGGVLSFELSVADRAKTFRFMEALEVCLPATTLGDIYSLVLHPATSSHRALTEAERKQVGIGEGLLRLSVGIEDVTDIIADLEQALKQIDNWR